MNKPKEMKQLIGKMKKAGILIHSPMSQMPLATNVMADIFRIAGQSRRS